MLEAINIGKMAEKLSRHIQELSLKVVPEIFKSVYHCLNMVVEKLKSVYYLK